MKFAAFRRAGPGHIRGHDFHTLFSFVASFVLAVLAVLILTVSAK
jgi:metal-dependent amidase/aminoacylase/carboxypeptidase family protein